MEEDFIVQLLAAFLKTQKAFQPDQLAEKTFDFFEGLGLINFDRVNPSSRKKAWEGKRMREKQKQERKK